MHPSRPHLQVVPRLPTLLHTTRGPLVVLVHGLDAPHPTDWNPYIASLRESVKKLDCTVLVLTDGAGPSAVQRDMLEEATPRRVRTAVVTASSVARGIVTLLSWFHPNMGAYAPGEIDKAFDYLAVPRLERPLVLKMVAAMRAQLSGVGVGTDIEALAMLKETAIEPMDAVVARLGSLRKELASRRRR